MKFSDVWHAARSNFPINEYNGAWLDYDQMVDLLKLAKLPANKVNQVNYMDLWADSGEELFLLALDREVKKVRV